MNTVRKSLDEMFPGLVPFMKDAKDGHYDTLSFDSFTTTIDYIGLKLKVEVCVHTLRASQIFNADNDDDLFYEFSEYARERIARKAIKESGVEI